MVGDGRIGDDIGCLAAVGHLIGPLLHRRRGHRSHRLDAVDIHFGELLDEAKDAVQLADHAICLVLGDGNTGKAGDALHGGKIDGHGILRIGFFLPAIKAMSA